MFQIRHTQSLCFLLISKAYCYVMFSLPSLLWLLKVPVKQGGA